MQINIKRTVVLYLYILTVNIQCLPGMLSESQVIANKLQCQISESVNEILQIDNINKNQYGIYRTNKGHLITFDQFNEYRLDQDVLVYIDKKVRNQYIMKLSYEKNYDVEQYVIEGRNYVYIKTQFANMQNKKEIINLHLLNVYQQGSIKQIVQETLNGLQFSFQFKDQQDYFVQIIFATLAENNFKGTEFQVANLIQEIQKNYVSCKLNQCKKDKEFYLLLQNAQLKQITPKYIKDCSFKTQQSIQYYMQINSIFAKNVELEKEEIELNIEFTLECIKLMSSFEVRNHIKMEFDQYFCINNLIYHFRFISIQNQQKYNYYLIVIQVNNDINQSMLIDQLFLLIENLKCQKEYQINNHNLEKLIEMNSSFIQQQQNENKQEIKQQDNHQSKVFIEEKVNIKIDDESKKQINTQSKLLYSNNKERSQEIQFLQINQSQGSMPQIEINEELPLEQDQIKEEQQPQEIQQIISDDIFDQPLQIEEQQHQQRLNQIDQFERKTQEIQESINFTNSNIKQQQEQKIENVVFDEYNQSIQQSQNQQVNQDTINKQTYNHQDEIFKNNQNINQNNKNYKNNFDQDNYDEYETHHHHHHHHHDYHGEQYMSTQYEDDQLYQEYERPRYNHHHHQHHSFHHHNHKFDNQYQESENYSYREQGNVSKRNNLRGKNFKNDSLYENNDPEVIDRIIIEYNFSQRENDDVQQGDSSKKDHKKENPVAGPKKQQIQYGEDKSQQQKKQDLNNNNQSQGNNGNQQKRQNNKENSTQEVKEDEDKQKEEKTLSNQKQNNKNKGNQQKSSDANKKSSTDKKGKSEREQKQQEEEEADQSNQNNQDDDNISQKKSKQNKKENNEDDQENLEEDQAQNENGENEDSGEQQQNQEEPDPENAQEDPENAQEDPENAQEDQENAQEDQENAQEDQENAQEDQEEEKLQEPEDEGNQNNQENKQEKKKPKAKKKQSNKKNEQQNKQKKKRSSDNQQNNDEEDFENNNIDDENQEELYDFNGRYRPNDPFYEHRKSKRGRYPFNYPNMDPYQDMFGNERFWRYETIKRQQLRYPFNGYPYRHRKQTVDHSPFPHVNSYYKMHPFQQQTYHCSPWVGRDFYPDTGYGMSRVTAAYKGRYTDPDQVLRDLTIRQQQQKQWRKSVQQYRDQVGYKNGDYDVDFQPSYSQSYEDIVQQYPDYDQTIIDPNQFQPYEDKSKKTHDYLNDPQFQFRQGKKPLDKNFQKQTYNPSQFNPQVFNPQSYENNDCFVVYDQCNFQGNRLDLCGEYPDIPQYINGFKIFSFIVPDNLQIRFFQSTDFENNIQNVEGTSDCLKVPYELVPNQQK